MDTQQKGTFEVSVVLGNIDQHQAELMLVILKYFIQYMALPTGAVNALHDTDLANSSVRVTIKEIPNDRYERLRA